MPFGKFYIKNYHANYNSYFPLKVKGLTGKNIFINSQRLPLDLVFLMEVISQNPIAQRKFKTEFVRVCFLKSQIIDTFMTYLLITLTTFIL